MPAFRARPALEIKLKHYIDRSASITLTRADRTVTWQRQRGSLALVFPSHDLTHYAIEQTLGYRSGFYGLVADGWEISDFAMPWRRGPIPGEAREVELLVGLFDGMRRDVSQLGAAVINEEIRRLAAESRFGTSFSPRMLSDEDIQRVHSVRNDLLARWAAVTVRDELRLTFRCDAT